jgi:hypothetical protein
MKTPLKLIALAVVGSVGASNAIAMQGAQQKQVTYFYDDEEHTNMVGGTLLYCKARIAIGAPIRFTPRNITTIAGESAAAAAPRRGHSEQPGIGGVSGTRTRPCA